MKQKRRGDIDYEKEICGRCLLCVCGGAGVAGLCGSGGRGRARLRRGPAGRGRKLHRPPAGLLGQPGRAPDRVRHRGRAAALLLPAGGLRPVCAGLCDGGGQTLPCGAGRRHLYPGACGVLGGGLVSLLQLGRAEHRHLPARFCDHRGQALPRPARWLQF